MDCGDAGHILLSKRVADDLEQYPQWHPHLHDLGECEVKHGTRLQLVNLYTDEVGNPEPPEKFQRARQTEQKTVAASSRGNKSLLVTLAILLLMGFAIVAIIFAPAVMKVFSHQHATTTPIPASSSSGASVIPEKSIAVLPFENRSEEKTNAYFADGVQDEILTNLARIAALKVISRTSVMQYNSGTARNLREIGQQLGVAHLLEGSVQRIGNRVRVNAQLIDARTDAHLWAQTYDRDLADVFAIQSEIAKAIADQLQAKLSPSEKAAIEERPTKDLVAYDLYIQGKALNETAMSAALGKDDLLSAVRLLNEATSRDPNFLLAYCLLARSHELLYQLSFDHSPARCAMADEAVRNAVRIRSEAGETHLAQADYLYRCLLDYDRARIELVLAGNALPNNPRVFELTAYVDRRQSRWNESVSNLERALELDPRNTFMLTQVSLDYRWVRRYSDMAAALDRQLQLAPSDIIAQLTRGSVDFLWQADLKPLQNAIEIIVTKTPARALDISYTWFNLAQCEHDPLAAARALAVIPPEGNGPDSVLFPRAWFEGWLARMRGDETAAQKAFTTARAEMERTVNEQVDYGPPLAVLGLIDALLGRKQEAIAEGRRACELVPLAKDSINATYMKGFLCLIYAWIGEKNLAIEDLTAAIKLPGYLSYGELRLHPFWDTLRGDPRFEQILVDLAPK
jgi:serine/threonine-protein kinase